MAAVDVIGADGTFARNAVLAGGDIDITVVIHRPMAQNQLLSNANEEKKMQQLKTSMTVHDLILEIDRRFGRAAQGPMTPEQGWGLFVEEGFGIRSSDAAASETKDRNFQVGYLQLTKTLYECGIVNQASLHFKRRMIALKVNIFDKLSVMLIDDSWTVEQIVASIGHKLSIPSISEFSLKRNRDDPGRGWLSSNKTFAAQGIRTEAAFINGHEVPPDEIFLKQKLFFASTKNTSLEDRETQHVLFNQYLDMVRSRQLPVSEADAVTLAGYQLQYMALSRGIGAGPMEIPSLAEVLPPDYVKVKRIGDAILKKREGLAQLDMSRTVVGYVKIARAVPAFGWIAWEVKENVKSADRRTLQPRMLALSGAGIRRLDMKHNKPVTEDIPWHMVTLTDYFLIAKVPSLFLEIRGADRLEFQTGPGADGTDLALTILDYCGDYFRELGRMAEAATPITRKSPFAATPPPSSAAFTPGAHRPAPALDAALNIDQTPTKALDDVRPALTAVAARLAREVPPPVAVVVPAPPPPPGTVAETEHLTARANAVDKVSDNASVVVLGISNVVLAMGTSDVSLMNPNLLLAAADSLSGALRDLMASSTAAAALSGSAADSAAMLGSASATVGQAGGLVQAALALANASAGGSVDPLSLADLLAAAAGVSSSLSSLLGAVGVDRPESLVEDQILALAARLADPQSVAFAASMAGQHFPFLPVITQDELLAQAAALPDLAAQFRAQLAVLVPAMKTPLAKAALVRRVATMSAQIATATTRVPFDCLGAVAAGERLRATMAELSALIGDCTGEADYDDQIKAAAAGTEAAAAALEATLTVQAGSAAAAAEQAKALDKVGCELVVLASFEASALGLNGSFDGMLDAARALADALAGLKVTVRDLGDAGEGDAAAEVRAAAVELLRDASAALASFNVERSQLCIVRAVAKAADGLSPALDAAAGGCEGDARTAAAGSDRERLERAGAEGRRAAEALAAARRIYGMDPASLAFQNGLVEAAESAVAAAALVDAAAAGRSGSLKTKAAELAPKAAEMAGLTKEARRLCWPLDLALAAAALEAGLRAVRDAQARLASPAGLTVTGERSAAPREDFEAPLVARVRETLPADSAALAQAALRDSGPAMAARAKDVAREAGVAAKLSVSLAEHSTGAAAQGALLSAAAAAMEEGLSLTVKCGEAARSKVTDARAEFVVRHAQTVFAGSLRDLYGAVPGIGDCARGQTLFLEAAAAVRADNAPPGLDSLLELSQSLAAAMASLTAEVPAVAADEPAEAAADAEAAAAAARTADPADAFKAQVGAVARSLDRGLAALEAAVSKRPETLPAAARAAVILGQQLVAVTRGAAGSPELKAAKADLLEPLAETAEALAAACGAAAAAAAANGSGSADALHAARGEVSASVRLLRDALEAAINPSADAQRGEFADAVRAIDAALATLTPEGVAAAGKASAGAKQPVIALQTQLKRAAEAAGGGAARLQTAAEGAPKNAHKEAKALAQSLTKLAGMVCSAAAVAASSKSAAPTAAAAAAAAPAAAPAAAASAGAGGFAYEPLSEAIKKVMSALAGLLKADVANEKKFKSAYAKVFLGVRDLVDGGKDTIGAVTDEAARAGLAEQGETVKTAAAKLAKQADKYQKAPEDEEIKKKFMSYAKGFATALKGFETQAKAAPMPGGAGAAPAAGAAQGDLLGAATALLTACKSEIAAANQVVADPSQTKAHTILAKKVKAAKEAAAALAAATDGLAPGQKECDYAAGAAAAAYDSMQGVLLDLSGGRLKATSRLAAPVTAAALATCIEGLGERLRALAAAAGTSGEALQAAAVAAGEALAALTAVAVDAMSTAPAPATGTRIGRAVAAVPEAALGLIAAAKTAGGEARSVGKVTVAMEPVAAALASAVAVLRAGESAVADAAAAKGIVAAALAALTAGRGADAGPGASSDTATAAKAAKASLIDLVRAAAVLATKSQSEPEQAGAESRALARKLGPVVDCLLDCLALGADDAARAMLLDAAAALADALRGLIDAAAAAQGSGGAGAAVSAAVAAVSSAVKPLSDAVASLATGTRKFDAAIRSLRGAASELDAVLFLARAGQLANEASSAVADFSDSIAERLDTLSHGVKAELLAARTTDEVAVAALELSGVASDLLELVEAAAAALDDSAEQAALLAAAKALAAALADLMVDTHEKAAGPRTAGKAEKFDGAAAGLTAGMARALAAAAKSGAELEAVAVAALELKGSMRASAAAGGGTRSVAELTAAAKALLLGAQRLLFAAKRGTAALSESAAALLALCQAVAAAAGGQSRGLVPSVATAADGLLDAIAAEVRSIGRAESELTDAAGGVFKAGTVLVAELSKAESIDAGEDAGVAFGRELEAVLAEVRAARERLAELRRVQDELQAATPDFAMDGFVRLLLKACSEIATACASLLGLAKSADGLVDFDGMIVAAKGVAAASSEVVSVAGFFIRKEADVSALERVLRLLPTAIGELVAVAAGGLEPEQSREIHGAQSVVQAAIEALLKAARDFVTEAAAAAVAPAAAAGAAGGGGGGGAGAKPSAAASSNILEQIRRRAEVESLQRDIEKMKARGQ